MDIYKEIKSKISEVPKFVWILLLIIFIGVFFRTYHFHDWLQFKGDAFRDASLVSNVYESGVASLPLLGPRAGGTMLRLGPVFYDFQYISALIFQSVSAPVLAYPDAFFSILTLPVFFFFSRRYFSPLWSLGMVGMLAVSFLAVEYGRFAWNPNSTLFFTLVFSYALLRLYDTESEKPRPILWAFVAGTALSIASQLHFSAFLGLPIALLLFVLFHIKDSRKVLSYKVVLVFLASVLVINSPILFSEFLKGGENTRLFFSAIETKAASHGIFQNIFEDIRMFAKYFIRIGLGIVDPSKKLVLLATAPLIIGFLANVLLLRNEENKNKRNFLQWTLILMVVYFLLYIPLAFKINRPRFYLPFMMMPYLYLGYIIVFLRKNIRYPRLISILAVIGLSIILISNIRATLGWFSELKNSEQTSMSTGEKNSKGTSFFLTWGHYERVAKVIDDSCEKQSDIYFSMAKNVGEYDNSIEYALLQRKLHWDISSEKNDDLNNSEICYYFISFPKDPLPEFITTGKHDSPVDVGNLHVIRMYPEGKAREEFMENKVTVERRRVGPEGFAPDKIKRYSRVFWGDVWNFVNQ